MKQFEVQENDLYYFDSEAAEKPIRFITKFCRHYEGRCAGEPFELLDWQQQLIRCLFGWKRRSDTLRRFRELYLISAKGAGKTPLLSAIGLYMLLGDGEQGAHVISMASSFEQANLTFDAAKKYILACPALERVALPQQHQIRVAKTASKWTTVSGKPNGRSGPRPSCIIADEAHEWPGWTGEAFEMLTANLFKRSQHLLLVATNAGASKSSYAWRLHERALRVLSGDLDAPTLLPVVFEAPPDLEWTSEAAAKAANPSLGTFIKFEQLQPQLAKALSDPDSEVEYRRLYLSQWHQSSHKWLSLPLWDGCVRQFNPAELPDAVLYASVDLSGSDDLSAAAFAYVTPERLYVDAHFWLPRATAERYQRHDGIPYTEWAGAGAITLVDEPTISTRVLKSIADYIIDRGKTIPIKAVCYDPYRANYTVAALEAAGITALPTRQGFTLTPGCEELDKRLKERSITISPNPVLRWNADVVEVTPPDQRGNFWVVKPNAGRNYAGKRGMKIDGIAALVTALVEARKHEFPRVAKTARAIII